MTQLSVLRAAFDRGEELTVAEALAKYGIYALSQRCQRLLKDGYPLDKGMITLAGGKRVCRYWKMRVAYG